MNPALVPKPIERRDRDERLGAGAGRRERGRVADRAVMSERQQRDPDARAAEMSDRQVRVHRRANRPVSPSNKDRRRRHERHQLPERQETDHVTSRQDADKRQQERRSQCSERSCAVAAGQIVARKDQRRHRGQREHSEEEPAQRIKTKCQTDRAAKTRAEYVAAVRTATPTAPRSIIPAACTASPARKPRPVAASAPPNASIATPASAPQSSTLTASRGPAEARSPRPRGRRAAPGCPRAPRR